MNLGLCIANLLRQYPEVNVPGIGIFRKISVPASFEAEGQVFSAPGTRIELVEGQGSGLLLTDYLRAQRQLSEESAGRMLDELVQGLIAAAQHNGKVLLSGLGYLIADGASLVFEQLNPADLTRRPVKALHPLTPAVTELSPGTTVEEPGPVIPAGAADDQPVMEQETAAPDEDEETLEEPSRRTGRWVAAAVVVALLAGGIWFYQPAWLTGIKQTSVSDQTDSEQPVAGQTAQLPLDSGQTDSTGQPVAMETAGGRDSVPAAAAAAPAPVEASKPAVTYEIIVGSFATMRQADKYVKEMKAKGYDLKAIESRMPGNRKKISWGSFATEEEAYRELVSVQKNFEPGAWIAKVVHDGTE